METAFRSTLKLLDWRSFMRPCAGSYPLYALIHELAKKTRQANHLAFSTEASAVVIAQQEAPEYWGMSIWVGSHVNLFDTGSGHVLLAFRNAEEREMMISEHVRSRKDVRCLTRDFYARLDQIRERGYEMMASPDGQASITFPRRSWGLMAGVSPLHLLLYCAGHCAGGAGYHPGRSPILQKTSAEQLKMPRSDRTSTGRALGAGGFPFIGKTRSRRFAYRLPICT